MIKARCPICGKEMELQRPEDWPRFPFCGERCRTIDLGRWLDERYGLPAAPHDPEAPGSDDEQVP